MLKKTIAAAMAFFFIGGTLAMSKGEVNIAYVKWSSEIASTNVARVVLEKAGYKVNIIPLSIAIMHQAVADGQADAMLAAWLPTSSGEYYKKFRNEYVDLGPNLEGTKQGFVVPAYTYDTGIHTIADLEKNADKFRRQIFGIESGTGTNRLAEEAIQAYGLKNIRLQPSSEVIMIASLRNAIKNHEDIVVTGWTPHWIFKRFALKYLEDPKKSFGGAEAIHTIVRKGLQEDMPEVYKILDNFYWTPENMAELILMNQEKGSKAYDNAKKWVAAHPKLVAQWLQ